MTEQLVRGVEVELQKRMDELDRRSHKAALALDQLSPRLDGLLEGLRDMQMNQDGLKYDLQGSNAVIRSSLEDATNLQQLLRVIIDAAIEQNSQFAAAREQSMASVARVDSATEKAADQVDLLVSVMTTAAATTFSLHQQLVSPRLRSLLMARC